jgi:hypothetical protein
MRLLALRDTPSVFIAGKWRKIGFALNMADVLRSL